MDLLATYGRTTGCLLCFPTPPPPSPLFPVDAIFPRFSVLKGLVIVIRDTIRFVVSSTHDVQPAVLQDDPLSFILRCIENVRSCRSSPEVVATRQNGRVQRETSHDHNCRSPTDTGQFEEDR